MERPRLPPFDLIVPFESAARLGSFTRAAEELNVTQSAVSQRVRKLEDQLGVTLFLRRHRRIELTASGRELLNGATVALNHLTAATASLRRAEQHPRLSLATDTSIAALWLPPRLARFRGANPKLAVDLTVSDREEACRDADVAILHGSGDWPGFESRLLFGDKIFPVAAPAYADRHPIKTPADLLSLDLIDLDYQHWNWMNWGIWLTECGLDPHETGRVFQSNSYPAVIDAARAGWGVALGWEHFLDEDLAAGRLQRLGTHEVTTRFGYHLLVREGAGMGARSFATPIFDIFHGEHAR
ncbi:MAG: LysR substrate-binding domain-containing protein [Kiloniellales bacterium]